MSLKDWNKKGEDWYETKGFPRGEIFVEDRKKDGLYKGTYALWHKPANIGAEMEVVKRFRSKKDAHEAIMNHIKNHNW